MNAYNIMYNYAIALILKVPQNSNTYISAIYKCSSYQPLVGTDDVNYIALDFILEAPSAYDAYNNVIADVMAIIPNATVVNKTIERLDNNNDIYP